MTLRMFNSTVHERTMQFTDRVSSILQIWFREILSTGLLHFSAHFHFCTHIFRCFFHLTKDLYYNDNRCMHDYILIFSVGLFYYKDGHVGFKNSRLRHVESRRSNSVLGHQEKMWSYDNSTILSF